ncbi:Glucan 1,3-beta-glucosidase [Zancudomyces culisetae]|uniref:glucan endo-1,3-beta-D-glucosidase n=1 Tax=Zancudomyces culisetae TaxID=1213189 RepID=A0A1R1PDV1_ZANCU|nr:Glucan 1,3-beta-glucosidase [Zancudomyces culisetae]|eukprot:OMH79175.1 Glucan 1,3-beta-glucosidase [Zancudomyces culisetae]
MAPYTDTIKIFSVKDCNQGEPILRAVEGTSWKVVLGMWVGPDDSAFNADVQELTRLNSVFDLKKYVKYVVVGSESLYRKDQTEDQLIAKINQARQLLNSLGLSSIPVTTADVYLNYSARLASAVDFVMMNAFTYWEGVPIEAAANTMFEHINAVKAISGGKRVVVGETGWPTDGSNFGAAVPSLANSARYLREFICRARAEQVEYFWYLAIDTPWNTTPDNTVEAHFGILDADHNPKYPGNDWANCSNTSTSSSLSSTSTSSSSSTTSSSSTPGPVTSVTDVTSSTSDAHSGYSISSTIYSIVTDSTLETVETITYLVKCKPVSS